jgi:hypothetical protein
MVDYCLDQCEIARKQERLKLNVVDAGDLRRLFRRMINNFEKRYDVKMIDIKDDKISPWTKEFIIICEPVKLELFIMIFQIKMFVTVGLIRYDRGIEMANGCVKRCVWLNN